MTVMDEGEGIPDELHDRVFTRFWRSGRRGGTGLGLYIVRGLVEAHGGHIEVGRGARRRREVPIRAARRDPGLRRLDATGRGGPQASATAPGPSALRRHLDSGGAPTGPTGAPMSAPNKSYDPVQVSPLNADEVERARDEALAAIAAAADLDALKQVRLDHAGDRSPLALANREIGALPPAAKAEAGKRVGQARASGHRGARRARRPSSSRSATSGCWSRRRSTSRCPGTGARAAPGTRSPP